MMFFKFLNSLIPLLIITSSIKINGYVSLFLIFLPFLIKEIKTLKNYFFQPSLENKFVFIYLLFLIAQSFIGSYYLKDIRIIIFWAPYFLVCLLAYFHNLKTIDDKQFYRKNILNIINNSCIVYFALYFLLNLFSLLYYGNFYQIQELWWIGGSGAFHISSLLLITNYLNAQKENYKINIKYFGSLVFFIIVVNINNSRLGILYLFVFAFFTLLDFLKKKRILNGFLIISIILSTLYLSNSLINKIESSISKHIETPLSNNIETPLSNKIETPLSNNIETSLSSDIVKNSFEKKVKKHFSDRRYTEIFIALDKFKANSLKEKIFGTGWYTSRITLASFQDKYTDAYSDRFSLYGSGIYSINGFQGLLLDTGLIGICFTFLIYSSTLKIILTQKKINKISKFFFTSMLLINLFCLFIGYPFVNTIFVLFYLPHGILNTLISKNTSK